MGLVNKRFEQVIQKRFRHFHFEGYMGQVDT